MYDSNPYIPVSSDGSECRSGWEAIADSLRNSPGGEQRILCVECYPGVFVNEVRDRLAALLKPCRVISTEDLLLTPEDLDRRVAPMLTDDPVFGVMNCIEIEDYFDAEKLRRARAEIAEVTEGLVLVVGTGAVKLAPQHDLLVYADLARWEIQKRQRRGEIGNLGADNQNEPASQKYKRGFFLDWRAADRVKEQLLPNIDFVLDTNAPGNPKLISGDA